VTEVRALYGRLSCGRLGGSARGDTRYGGKWAWLAGRGRCTASSLAQRAVRIDWGGEVLVGFKQLSSKGDVTRDGRTNLADSIAVETQFGRV